MDSIDGAYAYLYAAELEAGAFAESFARDLTYARTGPRPLPHSRVQGRAVSDVEYVRDARFVSVDGAGAQQLGQDDWLTHCDESEYPICREWAVAVRTWVPDADGLTWISKLDPAERVYVLWGDPAAALTGCGLLRSFPEGSEPLERGPGRIRLDDFLVRRRLYIEPGR